MYVWQKVVCVRFIHSCSVANTGSFQWWPIVGRYDKRLYLPLQNFLLVSALLFIWLLSFLRLCAICPTCFPVFGKHSDADFHTRHPAKQDFTSHLKPHSDKDQGQTGATAVIMFSCVKTSDKLHTKGKVFRHKHSLSLAGCGQTSLLRQQTLMGLYFVTAKLI